MSVGTREIRGSLVSWDGQSVVGAERNVAAAGDWDGTAYQSRSHVSKFFCRQLIKAQWQVGGSKCTEGPVRLTPLFTGSGKSSIFECLAESQHCRLLQLLRSTPGSFFSSSHFGDGSRRQIKIVSTPPRYIDTVGEFLKFFVFPLLTYQPISHREVYHSIGFSSFALDWTIFSCRAQLLIQSADKFVVKVGHQQSFWQLHVVLILPNQQIP